MGARKSHNQTDHQKTDTPMPSVWPCGRQPTPWQGREVHDYLATSTHPGGKHKWYLSELETNRNDLPKMGLKEEAEGSHR